jgi:hypothetical protein
MGVLRRSWVRWTIRIGGAVTLGAIGDAITHRPWFFGPLLLGTIVAGQALFSAPTTQRRPEGSQANPTDSK